MKDEWKQTTRTEQGVEASGDYNSGKHERDGGQRAQEGLAAEVEAGEEDGGRKTNDERQKGGEGGLVKRKTKNGKGALEIRRSQDRQVEAEGKNPREGKEKENREEENSGEKKERISESTNQRIYEATFCGIADSLTR